jgi:hypothetical protein
MVVPVIPALLRLRQENHEFGASLDYTLRPCLKKRFQKDNDFEINYFCCFCD